MVLQIPKGNLCSIYEDRPLFCRIDDCYEQFFKEKYTRDEFYKVNYEICNKLKNKELCFKFTESYRKG